MSSEAHTVTSTMRPDEQIKSITASLMRALRDEIAALKATNPGEITRILLLDPGERQQAIKTLLERQITEHLSPSGVTLTGRVKAEVPKKAAQEGDTILREDWTATMQQFTGVLQGQGIFGVPGNDHLYRNTSSAVTPSVILANGCFRHRYDCSPVDAVLTHLFSGQAHEILFNYTRDPGSLPFTVVSATTETDNTLGQSPTWSYSFPKPALVVVPAAAIAAHLQTLDVGGGTVLAAVTHNFPAATAAQSVTACLGNLFTLRTDTGALPANLTAFVSTQAAQEHILLNPAPFTPGQDYFRGVSPDPTYPYRNRWKVLSRYATYNTAVTTRNLPL
jgi:hypothetical protein